MTSDGNEDVVVHQQLEIRAFMNQRGNVVLLQVMRALSGMLRTGVFHNRAKLYARPEVREVLLEQHRAIFEAVIIPRRHYNGPDSHARPQWL